MEEFASLSLPALQKRYAEGPSALDRRVLELPEKLARQTFRPEDGCGAWSCTTVIGHLADAEIAFVHRLRRAAAEEMPGFAVWDENAFVDRGLYALKSPLSLSLAFDALLALRKWTALWLSELPEGDFARKGKHPERGEQTLRNILEYAAWHLEHHGSFLNRKVEILLGKGA